MLSGGNFRKNYLTVRNADEVEFQEFKLSQVNECEENDVKK